MDRSHLLSFLHLLKPCLLGHQFAKLLILLLLTKLFNYWSILFFETCWLKQIVGQRKNISGLYLTLSLVLSSMSGSQLQNKAFRTSLGLQEGYHEDCYLRSVAGVPATCALGRRTLLTWAVRVQWLLSARLVPQRFLFFGHWLLALLLTAHC